MKMFLDYACGLLPNRYRTLIFILAGWCNNNKIKAVLFFIFLSVAITCLNYFCNCSSYSYQCTIGNFRHKFAYISN